jgi:hypothetical protein
MSFLFRVFHPFRLFGRTLGGWLEHVNHPQRLPLLCLDWIVLSFSTPLIPFFLSGMCDVDPARYYVELQAKPMATMYGNDTVAFR